MYYISACREARLFFSAQTVKTFTRLMVNLCQNQFIETTEKEMAVQEGDGTATAPTAKQDEETKKRAKKRGLTNMKIIGQLFLRQLLSLKVVVSVIEALLHLDTGDPAAAKVPPAPYKIDCIHTLFLETGFSLEADMAKAGRTQSLVGYMGKLTILRVQKDKDGKLFYEKRIGLAILELTELRKNGWKRKTFKEKVKTSAFGDADPTDVVAVDEVVGLRPDYMIEMENRRKRAAVYIFWNDV